MCRLQSSGPSEFFFLYRTLYCCQSDKLARETATQESKYVPSLWNNFLSFRGGLHIAWCSVGFKASEAFRGVSFPPWNLWISHITSYIPCQAAAYLATALLCPWLLLWLYGCATVSTCPLLSKTLFSLLFFFLSRLTVGKLSCEIWVQWNCHPFQHNSQALNGIWRRTLLCGQRQTALIQQSFETIPLYVVG